MKCHNLSYSEGSSSVCEAAEPAPKKDAANLPHLSEAGSTGEFGKSHFHLYLLRKSWPTFAKIRRKLASGEFAAFVGEWLDKRFWSIPFPLYLLGKIVARNWPDSVPKESGKNAVCLSEGA